MRNSSTAKINIACSRRDSVACQASVHGARQSTEMDLPSLQLQSCSHLSVIIMRIMSDSGECVSLTLNIIRHF